MVGEGWERCWDPASPLLPVQTALQLWSAEGREDSLAVGRASRGRAGSFRVPSVAALGAE